MAKTILSTLNKPLKDQSYSIDTAIKLPVLPAKSAQSYIPDQPLKDQLNVIFGRQNWFVYPDDNPNSVGAKRIRKNFEVKSPVQTVKLEKKAIKFLGIAEQMLT